MRYVFEIKERAIGKQRHRWNGYSMYTPTKTSTFEEKVRQAFLSKYNIQTELSTKPIEAIIKVYYTPAESLSKKKKEELLYTPYTKKPDVDNVAKAVLDSLNGLVYKDDAQITSLCIDKCYADENKILVNLEEIK